MEKVTFYIGADNIDKMVDKATVMRILDSIWDAYTLVPTVGVWKGEQENSLMAIVWSDKGEWMNGAVARCLCVALKQEAIGVESNGNFKLVRVLVQPMGAQEKEQALVTPTAAERSIIQIIDSVASIHTQEKTNPRDACLSVAKIEAVENRIVDGHLHWWLHCRMRDGSYYLFDNISNQLYVRICEEEAEYESLCLNATFEEKS